MRIIAPFPPGGSVDQVSRLLARHLAEPLEQSVVVENKTGASGSIGAAAAASAAPDGYTWLVVFDTHGVNPSVIPNMPFDTRKDLAPVMLIGTSPMALVARPGHRQRVSAGGCAERPRVWSSSARWRPSAGPCPRVVGDGVPLTPQTSYGTQKAIGELLIDDYSRHGFVDGRCLRRPIVMTRHAGADAPPPGAVVPTVSGAIASIVGDRLLGRDVTCPLAPDTRIAAASAERVVDALIAVHDLPAAAFGHTRAMNLPSLSLMLAELADASARAAERTGARLGAMRWRSEPRFQSAVDQWPRRFESARASPAPRDSDSVFLIACAYPFTSSGARPS